MAIAADGGPAAKIRDEASFACQSVFDVRSGAEAELVRLADAKAEQLAEVLGSACTAGEASRLTSEEKTSELQSLISKSYADFCLKKQTSNKYTCNYTQKHTRK